MTNYFIWWPYKRRQTLVRNWCCRTLWSMLNRSHKHWLSVNTTSIALTWIRLKRLHRLYKYWRKIQYVIDTLVESCHAVSDTRSCYNVAKLVTSTVIAERKQDQKKTKARESLGRVMEISGHLLHPVVMIWTMMIGFLSRYTNCHLVRDVFIMTNIASCSIVEANLQPYGTQLHVTFSKRAFLHTCYGVSTEISCHFSIIPLTWQKIDFLRASSRPWLFAWTVKWAPCCLEK